MENNTIVVTVDGLGVVESKSDRATFTLNFKSKADSLELAKAQVTEQSVRAMKDLKNRNMPLDGEISSTMANYKLEHREAGEKYPAGFQSVNTVHFTVTVDQTLNDIYQMCLKLDPNMPMPVFSVKNQEILLEQACQKAAENVDAKLQKECKLLGVSPLKLKILSWVFGYNGYLPVAQNIYGVGAGVAGVTGPQGSMGPYGFNGLNSNAVGLVQGPGGYQAPVVKLGSIYQELLDAKLEPSTVSVRVTVQVKYVWNE